MYSKKVKAFSMTFISLVLILTLCLFCVSALAETDREPSAVGQDIWFDPNEVVIIEDTPIPLTPDTGSADSTLFLALGTAAAALIAAGAGFAMIKSRKGA